MISQYDYKARCWKNFLIEDTYSFIHKLVSTMAADSMVMKEARVSAAMILSYFSWNILASRIVS